MAVLPTVHPTARCDLPSSGALCIAQAHTAACTHAILSTIFLASVRALYTCSHPGHLSGCAQGQEGAQGDSSALTGSYFQAEAFISGARVKLWLCLCPTWQPRVQTLTHCLGFPALPVICLVAKDFSKKIKASET